MKIKTIKKAICFIDFNQDDVKIDFIIIFKIIDNDNVKYQLNYNNNYKKDSNDLNQLLYEYNHITNNIKLQSQFFKGEFLEN